jgi:predicted phage terminase large subunit-like protein
MINCRSVRNLITSFKVDPNNDCSVCVTLLVDDQGKYYLLEVLRGRLLYPDLKAQALSQAKKHRPDTILIEEAGLGRTLIKDLEATGLPAIGVFPEGDKVTRVSVQLEKFANRQVFFRSLTSKTSFPLFLTAATMTRLMLSSRRWPTNAQRLYGMTPHLRVWRISLSAL